MTPSTTTRIESRAPEEPRLESWRRDLLDLGPPDGGAPPPEDHLARCAGIARRHLADEELGLLTASPAEADAPEAVALRVPLDPDLPAPPEGGRRPASKASWVSEGVLWGVALAAGGEPIGYEPVFYGPSLIHQVAPVPGHEGLPCGTGRDPIAWHTDQAHLPEDLRPARIWLLGLRNDDASPIRLLSARELAARLEPNVLGALTRPAYRQRASLLDAGTDREPTPAPAAPLLRPTEQGWRIALSPNGILPADAEASAALAALRDLLTQDLGTSTVLAPHPSGRHGTLMAFSNLTTAHLRGGVPGGRWMQRLYTVPDLGRAQAVASGHGGRILQIAGPANLPSVPT